MPSHSEVNCALLELCHTRLVCLELVDGQKSPQPLAVERLRRSTSCTICWRAEQQRTAPSTLKCKDSLRDDGVDEVLTAGDTRDTNAALTLGSPTPHSLGAQWTRLRRLRMWMPATDMSPQRVQRLLDALACRRTFPALRSCPWLSHHKTHGVSGSHPSGS